MALPPGVASYGDPAYWEARFGDEDEYEWCGCGAWDGGLADAVVPALAGAARVLILGAGTSRLPLALAAEGGGGGGGGAGTGCRLPALREVVATDISPTAVAKLQALLAARAADAAAATATGRAASSSTPTVTITAAVADMLDLSAFPAGSFDAVIEKGTFDVLEVAGEDGRAPDPWDPPASVRARMHAALAGAHRVLRPGGGVLVSITWAPPLFRRGHYLDDPRYDWGGPEVVVEGGSVGGAVPVVVYALRRGDREAGGQWRRPPPGQVCRGGGDGEGEGLPAAPAHEGMDDEDYLLRVGLGGDESD